jgi:Xaa-Pro aminopeptidase
MFSPNTYIERRNVLIQTIKSGIILLLGHKNSPINHAHQTYPFRQDSTFLYYFGLNLPNLAGIIDTASGETIIFGNDAHPDELIWFGPQTKLAENASKVGIYKTQDIATLAIFIKTALRQNRQIHIIPEYRYDTLVTIAKLLHISPEKIALKYSATLLHAIVNQRSYKSAAEINEIKAAINITHEMFKTANDMLNEGLYEYEILAEFQKIATHRQTKFAFTPIISVHGEFLHNFNYHNQLKSGQLLLIDAGVESKNHYAADITRTYPINRSFNTQQKAIYDIVSQTQKEAIAAIKSGILYKTIHLGAARCIFNGLKALGLTTGDTECAIQAGAHKLFFPHKISHMLGLDTHDMSGLRGHATDHNENAHLTNILKYTTLTMDLELKTNFCLTIEPGIYFIPILIDRWESTKKFQEFINYSELKKFRDFGGIRIEDDILVTSEGAKNLSINIR